MDLKIVFRAIIEVLGKPKDHVDMAIKNYIGKLQEDQKYDIISSNIAPINEQEGNLFSTYAEVELKTESIEDLMSFCFEYMPSVIEIIEPSELSLTESNLNNFFAELQAKLHHIDMVAKQSKAESDYFKRNMTALLKNYVKILLTKKNLTSNELSNLIGVDKDTLEDFLDNMIDKGEIDLKEDRYCLKENANKKD